ncbi:MAG: tryptophan synthase subunit alpha [Candidatus Nitrosocosmicus sp.]|nr:tryptophan synthase subunit alpha [Candidatus Nitrosocosmicus sp.]
MVVGFGINSPKAGSKMLEAGADGIIIASGLTKIISDFANDREQMLQSLGAFIEQMKKACKIKN